MSKFTSLVCIFLIVLAMLDLSGARGRGGGSRSGGSRSGASRSSSKSRSRSGSGSSGSEINETNHDRANAVYTNYTLLLASIALLGFIHAWK